MNDLAKMATATNNITIPNHFETIKVELKLEPPDTSQLDDTCACCLLVKQTLTPETDKHIDMMWSVFNIQLIRAAPQKRVICEECIASMEAAASFKRLVLSAQDRLSKMAETKPIDSKSSMVTVKLEKLDTDWSCVVQDAVLATSDSKLSTLPEVLAPKKDIPAQKAKRKCTRKVPPEKQKKRLEKIRKKKEKAEKTIKRNAELLERSNIRESTITVIENSNLTLFGWYKNKYKCFCCKETFLDSNLLKNHSKIHTVKEIKEIIGRYNSKYYFKAEVTLLQCKKCGMNIDNIKNLMKHLTIDHNIKLQVEDTLLIAYKLNDEFYCQSCNEKFKSFICLDRHMNVHFKNYVCDVCGKGFRAKHALTIHAMRHDGTKKFECKPCNMTFPNFYRKRQHVVKQHNCTVGHVCPYCSEKFPSYYNRQFHLFNAHGQKMPEFHCDTCKKCFINKALLKRHILKVHLQTRNVKCGLCDRVFFYPSELTRHTAGVHGTRDYKCTVCSKAFMQKRHLNNHLAIHIEALRHVCTFCKKSFAQKSNMKSHMKTHLKKDAKDVG